MPALESVLTRTGGTSSAFLAGGRTWSADKFAGQVVATAEAFTAAGVRPGDRIALLVPKSLPAVAAFYAALRMGIIAVPIDCACPAQRVGHMLHDCAPALVVVDQRSRQRFARVLDGHALAVIGGAAEDDTGPAPAAVRLPNTAPPVPAADLFTTALPEEDLAYIIYTSGSTGLPKGVSISRGALAAFLSVAIERAGYDSSTVFLSFFPMHFDPVLMEILAPWGVGGQVVLFEGMAMINDLVSALADSRATDFSCTPNVISMLVSRFSAYSAQRVPTLRSVWFGGETPNPVDVREFQVRSPGVRLFNGYGPTECTVACSLEEVPDLRPVEVPEPLSIGTPMPGTTFDIVTDDLDPIEEDGVVGELLVGGAQLLTGYWGTPEHAAPGLVTWRGQRRYRTGDLVHRAEGRYYFDGRISRLMKIRGYRVHLDEVEHALKSAESVRDAVVVEAPNGSGIRALVETGGTVGREALHDHLRRRLPAYMVPDRITVTDRLPRTTGGKVDMAKVAQQTEESV